MTPQKTKIAWILAMDRTNAATRLQGYLIHEWMIRNGIDSTVVASQFQKISNPVNGRFLKIARQLLSNNFTHVVFEAPEWCATQLSMLWKASGGISVCVRCDRVPGQYDNYYDLTILPTEGLAESLGIRRRSIIPDSIEVPFNIFKRDYSSSRRIKVVWVGHQGYQEYITSLVRSLKSRDFIDQNFDFTLISKGDFADRQWTEETIFRDVLECDIAFIPLPEGEWFNTKSSNRLAMMMALGMPILASRIPSYLEIAQDRKNVLFVNDEESMVEALLSMQDLRLRASLGKCARSDLGDLFSIERIGPQWARAILGASNSIEQMPPVTVKTKLLSLFLSV